MRTKKVNDIYFLNVEKKRKKKEKIEKPNNKL